MAGEIIVKVKPDTRELDKELKKPRTFAGILGFGGVGGGGKKEDSKTGKDSLSALKDISKRVGLTALVVGALFSFIKPLLEIVKAVSALIFLAFAPFILPAFKSLVKTLPFLKVIAEMINKVLTVIDGFQEKLREFLGDVFASAWDAIVKAWDVLKLGGLFLWENIILPGFESLLTVGKDLADFVMKGFKVVIDLGKNLATLIINGFKFLVKVGRDIWEKILKPGFNFLKDVGSRIWGIIKRPFELFREMFRSAIGGVMRFINSLIPGTRFDIPELANGGIVTRPTLALIGERGPEAVIPLGQAGGFGGNTIQNTFHLGPINNGMDVRAVAEEIAQINKDELAMSTGSQRF